MAVSRFKLNVAGFVKLRHEPKVVELLHARAEKVLADLGDGYEIKVSPGRARHREVIVPATPEADLAVARNPAIMVRALNAGRS